MRRIGKTTSERNAYNKFSAKHAHITSNLQPDNGERIPLIRAEGVKAALIALRETRRLNKSWTEAERKAARVLIVEARRAGWTWRELSRQLGITDSNCMKYWEIEQGETDGRAE